MDDTRFIFSLSCKSPPFWYLLPCGHIIPHLPVFCQPLFWHFHKFFWPPIATTSCNSFQKYNKRSRIALAHGGKSKAPTGGNQRRALGIITDEKEKRTGGQTYLIAEDWKYSINMVFYARCLRHGSGTGIPAEDVVSGFGMFIRQSLVEINRKVLRNCWITRLQISRTFNHA